MTMAAVDALSTIFQHHPGPKIQHTYTITHTSILLVVMYEILTTFWSAARERSRLSWQYQW